MSELPSGTVTMLFADIEGSTSLVHRLGDDYGAVLGDYRRLLREAVADAGGHEVDCRADELFAAFPRAANAVAAALSAQRKLAAHVWPEDARIRARMGLHTGEPVVEGDVYLGIDVHRAVRICAAGHGGQILMSRVTHDLVASRAESRDLGAFSLPGLPRPEQIYQLVAPQLRDGFPPLRATRGDRSTRRSRPSRQTLAETAWQVQRMLPETATALKQPMAELGAALFVGDRAARGVDKFLERVDDRGLARRLADERVRIPDPARNRKALLEIQTACLERLRERRTILGDLALDLGEKLAEFRTAEEIEAVRDRVLAVTEEVDDALGDAARSLDPLSYKLRRTRQRGIYRSGSRYAVRFVNEAGDEQLREFDTLSQASDFRTLVRIAGKNQRECHGAMLERIERHVTGMTRDDDGRPGR